MRLVLFTSMLWTTGCGFGHRQLKFFAPDDMVLAPGPDEVLMEIEFERGGVRESRVPETMLAADGTLYERARVITGRDTLVVVPTTTEAVPFQIYLRGNAMLGRHDFRPVQTVTGSLPHRFPNEVVFLPDTLDCELRFSAADLSNPYNNYVFDHGDLLVLEAGERGHEQRLMFKMRSTGVHGSYFAGLLATIPISDPNQSVAPILALGPSIGWRTRKSSGPLLLFDTTELVLSVGIGSTALTQVLDVDGLDGRLGGVFNAALAGGGVRLFRVFTLQGFVNVNRFFRAREEAPATLAVGIDARGLFHASRDVMRKVFRENPVRERGDSPAAETQ